MKIRSNIIAHSEVFYIEWVQRTLKTPYFPSFLLLRCHENFMSRRKFCRITLRYRGIWRREVSIHTLRSLVTDFKALNSTRVNVVDKVANLIARVIKNETIVSSNIEHIFILRSKPNSVDNTNGDKAIKFQTEWRLKNYLLFVYIFSVSRCIGWHFQSIDPLWKLVSPFRVSSSK